MHLLGVHLPDTKQVKIALTRFYGIGPAIAARLCAHLSLHDRLRVSELSEAQVTALSSFLSAPPALREGHPLAGLKIESDLRREVRGNIEHMRSVGSYRGRRHAMGLPVRGQRTKTNAKTARKLNKIERRGYATYACPPPAHPTPAVIPSPLARVAHVLTRAGGLLRALR